MINFKKTRDEFIASLDKYQIIQEEILLNIIQRNQYTVFGKKYNFSKIRTVADYQKTIPITTYEDYKEYIEKIIQNKSNVLTRDKVILIEPTSGSSGATKFIPYTENLKKDFIKAIEPWFCDLFLNFPDILNGTQYWSMTPAIKYNLPKCKVKVGFENDTEYIGTRLAKILNNKIINIDCNDDFISNTAKTLLKEKKLNFIFIWSPTYLLLLYNKIKEIEPKFSFNNIKLISCWADGNSRPYYNELQKLFKNTYIQEKGLIATEAIMTIPIENIGKIPCVQSNFFEFRDIETNKIYLLQDLKVNNKYSVILTTSGGLYRYEIGDIVKVYNKYKNCPLLEFISKFDNVSDYFGEKLNEFEVKKIMKDLEIEKISDFYLFAPDKNFYTLYIKPKTKLSPLLGEKFENELLKNFHYKYCRNLGQLEKMKIFIIEEEKPHEIYVKILQNKGMRLGDIKMNSFSSCKIWNFKGKYLL